MLCDRLTESWDESKNDSKGLCLPLLTGSRVKKTPSLQSRIYKTSGAMP